MVTEAKSEELEIECQTSEYMSGLPLTLLMLSLCIGTFLVSLDRTIITVPIPQITADFKSTADIGWYGAAYSLTSCGCMPLYGRAYQSFNVKWTFLGSMAVFALGSLVCAATPTSDGLIVGRAIAGLGNAGAVTGGMAILTHVVALEKRAIYNSFVLMMYTIGAIAGPLFGGLFVDKATWRWCFWINLPVIVLTSFTFYFTFKPKPNNKASKNFIARLFELDLPGGTILLAAAVMFFTALQYTSAGNSWGTARVIGLLVGSGIATLIFITWIWHKQDNALIPLGILKDHRVAASCVMGFFVYGTIATQAYYLPTWFQAIKGDSAIQSGVHMLPYTLGACVSSLLSGAFVNKTGLYTPPAVLGSAIAAVGSGLLATLAVNSSPGHWIGYQVLASFGAAMAIAQGYIAIEVALGKATSSIGLAAMLASQSFGASVFVAVGNTILQDSLLRAAERAGLQGIDISQVIGAGATKFRVLVSPEDLPAILKAYNSSLQKLFYSVIPLVALSVVVSCFLGWKRIAVEARISEGSLSDRDEK
ncbi:MFS general substrate transporter [Stipitochalara longipes BDJ]|nr:MFS general substrate transporter [Stipitochalara longipes BDJ]